LFVRQSHRVSDAASADREGAGSDITIEVGRALVIERESQNVAGCIAETLHIADSQTTPRNILLALNIVQLCDELSVEQQLRPQRDWRFTDDLRSRGGI